MNVGAATPQLHALAKQKHKTRTGSARCLAKRYTTAAGLLLIAADPATFQGEILLAYGSLF
jgi:hypothetical protein